MISLVKRYRDFPIFSTFAFVINQASREVPLLLLAIFYSPVVTGLYGLAMRVINMPMTLIGFSISRVFLQRATGEFDKGETLKNETCKLFGYLIYLSLPMVWGGVGYWS